MAKELLIKYATRSRPERMFAIIKALFENADSPDNFTLLLTWDQDDLSTYNKAILTRLKPYFEPCSIRLVASKPTTKIDAFNRDIDQIADWKYILHITDFTEIYSKGFDTTIINHMKKGRGFLSYLSANSDGNNHHRLNVISRKVYDKFGFLYNPKLKSNFEEEELIHRCLSKTEVDHCLEPIHRYVHPRWLYFSPDALLVKNIMHWQEDLETFEKLTYEG